MVKQKRLLPNTKGNWIQVTSCNMLWTGRVVRKGEDPENGYNELEVKIVNSIAVTFNVLPIVPCANLYPGIHKYWVHQGEKKPTMKVNFTEGKLPAKKGK